MKESWLPLTHGDMPPFPPPMTLGNNENENIGCANTNTKNTEHNNFLKFHDRFFFTFWAFAARQNICLTISTVTNK